MNILNQVIKGSKITEPHLILQSVDHLIPVGDATFSEKSFSQYTIPLNTNDRFYVFTDGFTDQFGGDKNRKFSVKRLKKLLIESSELPIPEQHIKNL